MIYISEDLETADYVAVYAERSEDGWELYMVLSHSAIEDDPQQLEVLADQYRLIPGYDCDFPTIWEDEE